MWLDHTNLDVTSNIMRGFLRIDSSKRYLYIRQGQMGGYTDSYRTKDPSLILDRWILDICTVQYNTYIQPIPITINPNKQKIRFPSPSNIRAYSPAPQQHRPHHSCTAHHWQYYLLTPTPTDRADADRTARAPARPSCSTT